MHRGVQAVIAWIVEHPGTRGMALNPPATPQQLTVVEDTVRSPLPSELVVLLSRWNGGELPSGTLLAAGEPRPNSILGALRELAERSGCSPEDIELPLPYFRTKDGPLLAFDRSAGPVADTWPIVDYPPEGGEERLVHRTFDGWCRLCLSEWNAPDFAQPFSLDRYLRGGQRHVEVEPDVAAAHATVAHAERRSGRPERALASYLRAGACVPPLPWCDFEALKLAVLLGDVDGALAASRRLSARAPAAGWAARATTPARVADLLSALSARAPSPEPLLRRLDQLAAQAPDDAQAKGIAAVRRALFAGKAPPPPPPARATKVAPRDDHEAWWSDLQAAVRNGSVRDDDLLFDPSYAPLRAHHDFADLLRIRREF
jgi:hypothetical protein